MKKVIHTLCVLPLLWLSSALAQEAGAERDIPYLQLADAARMTGPESASVTIDEYIDFACPHCAQFYLERSDSLEALVAAEGLRLTIRMFPIPRLLRGYQAAEAAFCAAALLGRPGFVGMAKRLFENQEAWRHALDPAPILESYARAINVPADEYRDCVNRDAMAPLIINDLRVASDMSVRGTPTFVFNKSGVLSGAEQFSSPESMGQFRDSIERVRRR